MPESEQAELRALHDSDPMVYHRALWDLAKECPGCPDCAEYLAKWAPVFGDEELN